MKPKKSEKVDLNLNRSFYFAIGLATTLAITWISFEWKTYDKSDALDYAMNVDDQLDEEAPITELNAPPPPPPPPPPPAPEVIEVVEDEEDIEEEVLESTEMDKDEVIEVDDLDDFDEGDVEVPFAVIEDVPLFPGCEKVKKEERKKCFQKKMQQHVRKHFRYPEIAMEMGIQGRVFTQFTISRTGEIINIKMRGPDKTLEDEARRIISKIPKITPGKQRGKPVKVNFALPIVFKLQ